MKEVKMFDALDIIIGMFAGIAAALIPALAVVAHVARQKAQQKAAQGATELLPLRQTCIFGGCWVVSVGAVVMMAMIGENQFQEALSPSTTFLGMYGMIAGLVGLFGSIWLGASLTAKE